jgi:hypothetical protein
MGPMAGTRPAMTPEARAVMQQVRAAAREYRTTGSAESQASLQSLKASLAAMGYTRTPHQPGNPAPTRPVAGAPAAGAPTTGGTTPAAPAAPVAAGTPTVTTVAGVSGVVAN